MRSKFEKLLDELHDLNFKIISDYDEKNERIVIFQHHTIRVTVKLTQSIDFDVYADLISGIYELGDLHSLTRRMLNIKKLCFIVSFFPSNNK